MLLRSPRTFLSVVFRGWRSSIVIVGVIVGVSVLGDRLAEGEIGPVPVFLPTVLGTATAFFIGFVNNESYRRWWEARMVWGALVNDSRTWARSICAYLPRDGARARAFVRRHIGFVWALNSSLRGDGDPYFHRYLEPNEVSAIESLANPANGILSLQTRDLHALQSEGGIDGFRFLGLAKLLQSFSDEMGMSERIQKTVFPSMTFYFTQIATVFFVVADTLVLTDLIGYWSIPTGWFIGFLFEGTIQSGASLVNPFERKPAGVPLDSISRTIEINLLQELGERSVPEPVQPVGGVYIL
jgi:putative membrane protein